MTAPAPLTIFGYTEPPTPSPEAIAAHIAAVLASISDAIRTGGTAHRALAELHMWCDLASIDLLRLMQERGMEGRDDTRQCRWRDAAGRCTSATWSADPRAKYCDTHKISAQRKQQRAHKRRSGQARPGCCTTQEVTTVASSTWSWPPWHAPPWYPRPLPPRRADDAVREQQLAAVSGTRAGFLSAEPVAGSPGGTSKRCPQHEQAPAQQIHVTCQRKGKDPRHDHGLAGGARGHRLANELVSMFAENSGDDRNWYVRDLSNPIPYTNNGPWEGRTMTPAKEARAFRGWRPGPAGPDEAAAFFLAHPDWLF